MDDMAASAGLVPLASGVELANWVRRLEGIPALLAGKVAGGPGALWLRASGGCAVDVEEVPWVTVKFGCA
jgi:hypothetical protein